MMPLPTIYPPHDNDFARFIVSIKVESESWFCCMALCLASNQNLRSTWDLNHTWALNRWVTCYQSPSSVFILCFWFSWFIEMAVVVQLILHLGMIHTKIHLISSLWPWPAQSYNAASWPETPVISIYFHLMFLQNSLIWLVLKANTSQTVILSSRRLASRAWWSSFPGQNGFSGHPAKCSVATVPAFGQQQRWYVEAWWCSAATEPRRGAVTVCWRWWCCPVRRRSSSASISTLSPILFWVYWCMGCEDIRSGVECQ